MPAPENKWFIEYTGPTQAHMFGVKEFVVNRRTNFQQMEVADTFFYGRCLFLDGKIQSAAFDEYIYHESLIHPAMLWHTCPRRIMIIGGGEGAPLREILKHPTVERVLMVDIDPEVVAICREYLPDWHRGCFNDPRLELLHMDARSWLEENDEQFDVIFSDLPEPVEDSPARRLYTRQYYRLVKERLCPGGVMAMQAGDFSQAFIEGHIMFYNTVSQVFPRVYSYHAFVPSFNTTWGYLLAFRDEQSSLLAEDEIDARIRARKLSLGYYDGETHRGMFSVPRDIREKMKQSKAIIDDDRLLTTY